MTMQDRMERLELSNKRLKCFLAFLVVSGMLGVAMGAAFTPPRVVRAQKFELIDSRGDVYATWVVENQGANLVFHGANKPGDERLRVYAQEKRKKSGIRIPGPVGQNTLTIGASYVGNNSARESLAVLIDRNGDDQKLGFQYETREVRGTPQYRSWISDKHSRLRNHDDSPWQGP